MALLVAVALAAVLWPLRDRLVDALRPRLEEVLSDALNTRVTIGRMRVWLFPLRVVADDVRLGTLVTTRHLDVWLLPRTSLRARSFIFAARVDGATVDVPGWVALSDSIPPTPGAPPLLPSFAVRAEVRESFVRLAPTAEVVAAGAAFVTGEFGGGAHELHFAGNAEDAYLVIGDHTLRAARAGADGHGGLIGDWRLDRVEATGDGIYLRSEPPAPGRLLVRGRVELAELAFLNPALGRLGGEAALDAEFIGFLDDFELAATVRVPDLTLDGERLGIAAADADIRADGLTVSAGRFEGFGGAAQVAGHLTFDPPFPFGGRIDFSALDVGQLAHLRAGVTTAALGGRMDVSGTIEPLAVEGAGDGAFTAPRAEAIVWRAAAAYGDGEGTVEIEASQAGRNGLKAALAVDSADSLSGSANLSVASPALLGAFAPIESPPAVAGNLAVSARLSGRLDAPRLDGRVTGSEVTIFDVAVRRLNGAFTAERTRLSTTGFVASLGQGSMSVTGAFALDDKAENDWEVRAEEVPVDTVAALIGSLTGWAPPLGRGTLAAQFRGKGPWDRVTVRGQAMARQFWFGPEWIQQMSLALDAASPRWEIDGEIQNRGGQKLVVNATGTGTEQLALTAHCDGWNLTSVQRGEMAEAGGRIRLDASLSGPPLALSGRVTAAAEELVLKGRRIGWSDLDAEAVRGRWQFDAKLLDGLLQLSGTLAPGGGWPFTVAGSWEEANFSRLLTSGDETYVGGSGSLRAAGRLSAVELLDGELRFDKLQIVNGPFEIDSSRPGGAECRRGECNVDLALAGSGTEIEARGTIAASGALRLAVFGRGDLRVLELAGSPVQAADGEFDLDVDVKRTSGGALDVAGGLRVDRASLDVGAPFAFSRVTGRFTLAGTSVRVDQLDGRLGTGTFSVGGGVDLRRGPNLSWTLDDVGGTLAPSLDVEIAGSGDVRGSWRHLRVDGRIDVERLLYDRDIELTDFLPSFNAALADAPRPGAGERVDLDLRISAPGELYVENNVAKAEAAADIRVTGTAAKPTLDGRIELLDGTVKLGDRVFELQDGTIDFRPELGTVAALNLAAVSTVDTADSTYSIDVRVTGTTADPRVTMSSDDPSLTQTDLAALLAVGKTAAQLHDARSPVSIGVQHRTKHLKLIDRIAFESAYSPNTGTFEPQIKVGKDLTDDVAVSVAQTFGVGGRSKVEADYRLTPKVFIPATWESQTSTESGAFGIGVKVRYEFWRPTPFTLLGGGFR